MKIKTVRDQLTQDLFCPSELPEALETCPGGLDVSKDLRQVIGDAIRLAPVTREEIAQEMSRLVAQTITVHHLNAWTAKSREQWRFPMEFGPAFDVATQSSSLVKWYSKVNGGTVLMGRDAIHGELGKLFMLKEEIRKREREFKKMMEAYA